MIAPEQWYEYQRQYQKYGLDMKPKPEHESLQERRQHRQKVSVGRKAEAVLGGERKIMLSLVLIGAIALIMVVVMTSYAAKITFDINNAKAENDVIMGQIEDLDVKVLKSTNISYIEGQAKGKLGMKNAGKNCVYISAEDVPEDGFADIIKEKAYN